MLRLCPMVACCSRESTVQVCNKRSAASLCKSCMYIYAYTRGSIHIYIYLHTFGRKAALGESPPCQKPSSRAHKSKALMSVHFRIPDARTELGHAKPPARALKAVKAANEGSKNAAAPGRFLRKRRRPDVADVASRKTLR